jgi:DNA-binding CsgD family transcriptional regulator
MIVFIFNLYRLPGMPSDRMSLSRRPHRCREFSHIVFDLRWPGKLTLRDGVQRWLASGKLSELMPAYVAQGWPSRTNRPQRLLAAKHAGFLTDLDVYTREEIDREPEFAEFLRPRGLGWGTATAIPVPSGDVIVIDVERRYSRGPIEREIIEQLDQLRPHLARATLLSARLSLERTRSAALALDAIGLPAAVLGPTGRAVTVNSRFELLMPELIRERRDRLQIEGAAADALFVDALERLARPCYAGCVRSIPIAATDDSPPTILHLVPMRGSARDFFSCASAILVVTPVVPKEVPTAEVIQACSYLTPAEARVAHAIADLQTVEQIAGDFGLSRETVRTQLKSVLAKTGVGRQTDLAALLAGTSLSASPP